MARPPIGGEQSPPPFHDQGNDISEQVSRLESTLAKSGLTGYSPIHTGPLIRREKPYVSLEGKVRKKLFDALFAFFRRCDVGVRVIKADKRWFGSGDDLERRLLAELEGLMRDNLEELQSYDRVIVYYDGGQPQAARILREAFCASLSNVEFRTVSPADYLLFQVADMACTLELVEQKRLSGGMSKSESAFFGGAARFKKNYLRAFETKRFGDGS